jgi:hypothetical protein
MSMPTDRRQRCKKCHQQFTRPQGTNRLYCFECRPERKSNIVELPMQEPEDGPTLVGLTREALAAVGRDRTWQGLAAIRLAELIDQNRHGASGAAGNVKAHREAMAIALAGAGEDADVIDMIFAEDA